MSKDNNSHAFNIAKDAKKLREEAKTWPEWMKRGVQEAITRAEEKQKEYENSWFEPNRDRQ